MSKPTTRRPVNAMDAAEALFSPKKKVVAITTMVVERTSGQPGQVTFLSSLRTSMKTTAITCTAFTTAHVWDATAKITWANKSTSTATLGSRM